MKLWVCGRMLDGDFAWGMAGVFSTEQLAVDACLNDPEYFVGPVDMDVKLPRASTPWAGAYIPALKTPPE